METLNVMRMRILEQCRVSPPPSSSPRPSLPFTLFDIPWLKQPPVERLFFFPFQYPTTHFLNSTLPDLKSSLSLTLHLFYPFAGTYRRSPDGRFEFHYSEGDSVSLTISEYLDADFHYISGSHARPIEKLLPLLPDLPISPESQPLLAVQVTLFPGQGLCLALVVHHTVCDGFSSSHFIKSWATACRADGSPPPPPPFLDRSVIADPRGMYWKISRVMQDQPSPPSRLGNSSGLASASFTLGPHQIKRLKHRAMVKTGEEGKPSFHCSTFVVACAYAWICHIKARGFHRDRVAHLFFAVDWRQRIRPSIQANYFGNCLGSACFVEARVGEITGEEGFQIACEVIGKSIEGIGDDFDQSMEETSLKVKQVIQKEPLTVAGSPKLRVYDIDFGWGKPLKVEVTSIRESQGISIAESRDEEGGIEIGVVLPRHEIDEYVENFANEL